MFDLSIENILHSNILNFIIMLIIIIILMKKLKIADKIESSHKNAIKVIEESKNNVKTSQKKLDNVKNELNDLPNEIKKIDDNAKKALENIKKEIEADANKTFDYLRFNQQKNIEKDRRNIVNELIKNASKESLDNALKNIKNILDQNPNMHQEFIDQFIDELNGIKING